MTENTMYLCGGTFFLLLLQIKKDEITKKEHRNGVVGDNNQEDLMRSMIEVYYPGFAPTEYFEKEVSMYRSCEKSETVRTKNLPFGSKQKHLIDAFDKRIKNDYSTVLEMWHTTVTHRLPLDSNEDMKWLIKAILSLIDEDEMPNETELYVLPSGRPATKKELLSWDEYCADSLLLGIWHYIITERPNNKLGRKTFEAWNKAPDVVGNQWIFQGFNGSMANKNLSFYLFDSEERSPEPEFMINADKADTVGMETADAVLHESADEAVVVEIVREEHRDELKQAPQIVHQTINNFHNYGNGMQAGVLNMAPGSVINVGGQKPTTPKNAQVQYTEDDPTEFYNLFVIGRETDMFNHKRFFIEEDRALEKGYTRDELRDRYLPLTSEIIDKLMSYPTIVSREMNVYEGVYMGVLARLTRISTRGGGFNIYFEPVGKVDMRAIKAEGYLFDIGHPFEYTHTHWAVKNINLMEALEDAEIEVMAYGEE